MRGPKPGRIFKNHLPHREAPVIQDLHFPCGRLVGFDPVIGANEKLLVPWFLDLETSRTLRYGDEFSIHYLIGPGIVVAV